MRHDGTGTLCREWDGTIDRGHMLVVTPPAGLVRVTIPARC